MVQHHPLMKCVSISQHDESADILIPDEVHLMQTVARNAQTFSQIS